MSLTLHASETLLPAVEESIRRSAELLLDLQKQDGHWCALLTADTTLESDFILLRLWMYPPVNGIWNPPNPGQIQRAAERILSLQLADGGFNIYANGPSEISASVKAYFALKLAGIPVDSVPMTKLRDCILSLGGIQSANSYTKVNLSLFDLYPRTYPQHPAGNSAGPRQTAVSDVVLDARHRCLPRHRACRRSKAPRARWFRLERALRRRQKHRV